MTKGSESRPFDIKNYIYTNKTINYSTAATKFCNA